MKLRTPVIRRLFHMSARDHEKVGQFISSPIDRNRIPAGTAGRYERHEVAFIHQKHVNKCADACVAMLLQFKGKRIPEHIVRAINPRGVFTGLSTDDLKMAYPPSNQWQAVQQPLNGLWEPEMLAYCLKHYGPIICDVNRHMVLLTGIHENHLYIHDPWRGANVHYSIDKLCRKLKKSENRECMLYLE